MNLISKEEFKRLDLKKQKEFLDYLIYLRGGIDEYFFKKLNKSQKQDYIENRIKSADWLEDYEFTINPQESPRL